MMLDGKVVVVTGAGRGIGRAVALAAAAQGARVAVVDNGAAMNGAGQDAGPAQETVAAIAAAGGEAIAAVASVDRAEDATAVVDQALARWGRVDGLVNNAGVIVIGDFVDADPADFDRQVQVNLYGAFNMARAVAPHFKAQEAGAFVHMTSSVGLIGAPKLPGYAASKFALAGLSRTLSFDMARFKVRSNCVGPSAATRMTNANEDTPEGRAYAAGMAVAAARPEQVAPLVLFLLSDAAQAVTGQIFGCRGDTVMLYSQPRPVRIAQRGRGWTAEAIARDVLPGWRSALTPLETTMDVLPPIAKGESA